MLQRASQLNGYSLRATDGEIGSVDDLLIDDQSWTVRWLVVDTGTWLSGRRVLLPSSHLGRSDRELRHIAVDLSREQVRNSPDVDTHRPVSRQVEASIYGYYGWNPYWYGIPMAYGAPMIAGAGLGYGELPPYPLERREASPADNAIARRATAEAERQREEDQHLRSIAEVTDYYIEASDGDIGHVEDFLIDEDAWVVRYVMVDTKNWWPGKFVLIAPEWVEDIRWSEQTIRVQRTREDIKNAPEFDPSRPVERDYEARLYNYYGLPPYWRPTA
ncbi:PRC-barrel domain-containing protein [Rhodoligotrophos defluvii]|uniref:PRC-barrel domain-containing protein n=1 Tax=Rhodoligotrophos defluvii TaxID=2561934 RepID=UPI0010C9441D|nr:PRC-barrel domain-containing protein [Rhodoligotrophos defluvii]